MFSFFPAARPFRTTYRAYSVSMLPGGERPDVENGGKIILPPSALEHLTRLNVVYPMLFHLSNRKTHRNTHAGVLEFVADEGKCYLPYWMLQNLLCEEGDLIEIESAVLPVAKFSKFQPLSTDFLDITNPKAILENALRNFACLTTGDVIAIRYNERTYELRVLETKPGNAVSIIECDMDVEFAPPEDYVEPEGWSRKREPDIMETESSVVVNDAAEPLSFVPFIGAGNRLDGKTMETVADSITLPRQRRGVPDYDYEIGTIYFIRTPFTNGVASKNNNKSFVPFAGGGTTIRASQKKEDT